MQKMWTGRFEGLDRSILGIAEGEEVLSHMLHVSLEQCLVPLQKAKDQYEFEQRVISNLCLQRTINCLHNLFYSGKSDCSSTIS